MPTYAITAEPSARSAPAVVRLSGSVWPVVSVGAAVVTAPWIKLPFCPLVVEACATCSPVTEGSSAKLLEIATVPDTGCVTAEPSTLSAVMDAMPCTVITSDEAEPAVPRAGCFADVDAPAAKGSDAAELAWVAGKFEIDTGTADALNWASVNAPVTAWLAHKLLTQTAPASETDTLHLPLPF